jgi:hypothetical protein
VSTIVLLEIIPAYPPLFSKKIFVAFKELLVLSTYAVACGTIYARSVTKKENIKSINGLTIYEEGE